MPLPEPERRALIAVARDSIRHGLDRGHPLPVDPIQFADPLREYRASFVTLHKDKELRGCIGTLTACDPLVVDVAKNAFNAAFRDPRFPPVTAAEEPVLDLHISILSAPESFPVLDEDDLVDRLRPGVDGLILIDGHHRATFLPSVWEQLPDPQDFVRQLKVKAGLSPVHWSPTVRAERYTCESIP